MYIFVLFTSLKLNGTLYKAGKVFKQRKVKLALWHFNTVLKVSLNHSSQDFLKPKPDNAHARSRLSITDCNSFTFVLVVIVLIVYP
jgi:hypothetical protein